MSQQRKYDSTVARIAGNLLSGVLDYEAYELLGQAAATPDLHVVRGAVVMARAIVTITKGIIYMTPLMAGCRSEMP